MNYWKVILATIVIFGAGVITGGLLVSHVAHPAHPFAVFRPSRASTQPYDNLPPELRPRLLNTNFVQRLNERLNLNPRQAEQIRRIISQSQQNTHDLWKLVAPQFQLLWHDTVAQIKGVLTPEQRRQFDFLLRQRQFRRQPSTNAPPIRPYSSTNGPAV